MSSDSPDLPGNDSEPHSNGSDDLDALMELLSNHRRRYVLYYLGERGDGVRLDELANRIVDWEPGTDERHHRHVLTDLQHKHLPKMEAFGVIERENDEIRRTDADVPVDPYLSLAGEMEHR